MSLNRAEQMIFDYLRQHPDERQHWETKVRAAAKSAPDDQVAAAGLQGELWRYYLERSEVVAAFREAVQREGRQRTSMRNLAEYLIRLWTPPRPKRKPANGGATDPGPQIL
ncbi:MAG: hypothetical protein RLZZ129_1411 [Verrucomicrobiota bacterium]|jgi:hypothetical protein